MKKASLSLLTFVLVFAASILYAEPQSEESVPPATLEAIMAYHEIFKPVWHDAYPVEDIEAITKAVPSLRQAAEKLVEAVNANGPVRLKPSAEAVQAATGRLSAAAEKDDQSEILSAVEQAHNKMHVIIELTDAHDH